MTRRKMPQEWLPTSNRTWTRHAAASHYLHHSTDCSCHQPQLDDAEPSAPACGRDWCAPAFGSTRLELMGQIIAENLVVTLLAGVMGLLLSVAFAYLGNTLLFAQEFSQTLSPPAVDASICCMAPPLAGRCCSDFVLTYVSSGIPAWRASRIGIVNALGGRLHK